MRPGGADRGGGFLLFSGGRRVPDPVCAGEEAGEAYVLLGEKVVGKIPLYYGAPVERQTEEKKSLWERIGGLLP